MLKGGFNVRPKRIDNQLIIHIEPEESRQMKHKQAVFQQHWYQKEIKENGPGNIYTILTDGSDTLLTDVRDRLNTLDDNDWRPRIGLVIKGFVQNMYLVSTGTIFEPYFHPSNFIYNPIQERVITFFRYDHALEIINKHFYEKVFKILAFILSDVDLENYDNYSIKEIEDQMNYRQYKYFRELVEQGNIETLNNYMTSESEYTRLTTYPTIVPDMQKPFIQETQFIPNWITTPKENPNEKSKYKSLEEIQKEEYRKQEKEKLKESEFPRSLHKSQPKSDVYEEHQYPEYDPSYAERKRQEIISQGQVKQNNERLVYEPDLYGYIGEKRRKERENAISLAFTLFTILAIVVFFIWLYLT